MDYVSSKDVCDQACGYQYKPNGELCFFKKDLDYYKWKKTPEPEVKWFKELSLYFQYLPKPTDDEWLKYNRESGQTFKNYARLVKKSKNLQAASSTNSNISIFTFQVDEDFLSQYILNGLQEFVEIYFNLQLKFEDKNNLNFNSKFKTNQENPTIESQRALSVFKTFKQKNDASAVAITTCDLAHGDSFVFGISDTELQVCVISLYRYIQHLIETNQMSEVNLMKKTTSVICHEIAHTFGLEHCIYYRCIMNGSNTIEEDDKLPLFLCPICLRKLHFLLNFDIELRYKKLMNYCLKYNFSNEYKWYKRRLENC